MNGGNRHDIYGTCEKPILKVEEVIPFKGDWNEENYALIIDASEEQISSIRQVINDREYTNYGFEMPITMQ